MLAILAGHRRYTHVTARRGDAVAAQALGMDRIVSEDALRCPLSLIDEPASAAWLRPALMRCVRDALKRLRGANRSGWAQQESGSHFSVSRVVLGAARLERLRYLASVKGLIGKSIKTSYSLFARARPAFVDSDLPVVSSITKSETDSLYRVAYGRS